MECWDVTEGTGAGLLFTLVETTEGVVVAAEVPVALLLRVLAVSGLAGG